MKSLVIPDRQTAVRNILDSLQSGIPVKEAKKQIAAVARGLQPDEIHDIEYDVFRQFNAYDGLPDNAIQGNRSPAPPGAAHLNALKPLLKRGGAAKKKAHRYLSLYYRENNYALKHARLLQKQLKSNSASIDCREMVITNLLSSLKFMAIHFQKIEKALFPVLIAKGLEEPTRFMGTRQAGIIRLIDEALEMAGCCSFLRTLWYVGRIIPAVRMMVYIEKRLFFPLVKAVFLESDFIRASEVEKEIGTAWVSVPAASGFGSTGVAGD